MNGTPNVRDVVSAEEGHARTKHRYAKTQPLELGFRHFYHCILWLHLTDFVKSASNMAHSPGSPLNGTGTSMLANGRSALSVMRSVMVGGIMHLP